MQAGHWQTSSDVPGMGMHEAITPPHTHTLPVTRHAKRGLIWVKPALNSFQVFFWAGVATEQAGFG
jgi:hypothetical protein